MVTINDLPDFQPTKNPPLAVQYYRQLEHLLDPLPASIDDKVCAVALRLLTAISAPVAYPILLTIDYLQEVWPFATDGNADNILHKQVTWLKTHTPPSWKTCAWKLIRKGRHASPSRELQRLRTMGILNTKREDKLEQALDTVKVHQPGADKRLQAKMLIAQALEIKELYGRTHHVFIHAQAAKWVIFSHLIKEFTRLFQPEKDIHQYKFLRAPCDTVDFGFLESFWNLFFDRPKTVQEYLQSKWLPVNDSDSKERELLLSVDGYFYNHQSYESSLYFLINNDNIFNNSTAIENFSKKVIQHFCPTIRDSEVLEKYAKKITQAAFKKAECGNLFVICLPKKESKNIQYRAHPFGQPCQCHDATEANKILSKLQENEILDPSTKCNGWFTPSIPQFRLYAPQLGPGDGKAIFLLTPFIKKEHQAIKSAVKNVAQHVCASATKASASL